MPNNCKKCGKEISYGAKDFCITCYNQHRKSIKKHCERCGKKLANGSKSLCAVCFRTRVSWRGPKTIVCSGCGKTDKLAGHGLCAKCYGKKYMKKYHSDYERNRRKEQQGHVSELDRKRSQTESRKAWKREYHQSYYQANREKLLEYQRNYRRADPERTNNYKKRRVARRNGLADTLTVGQWHKILEDYNHACAYCGKTGVKLEREHKIPAIKGGGYTAENIVPACGQCNRRKHTMTESEFREYLKKYPR